MGKSLKGKELGTGISQRKDGLYQARFTNRFGKRQTIYDKTVTGITKKLRDLQYADERAQNVIDPNITLDEWYDIWMKTCKLDLKGTTKVSYSTRYKRISGKLGKFKLSQLNLIVMQEAINELETDVVKTATKGVLNTMLDDAVAAGVLSSHSANKLQTKSGKRKQEIQVLTKNEVSIFLDHAKKYSHYRAFQLLLETGLRTGECLGLKWEDIDFEKRCLKVGRTLCYYNTDGTCNFEFHEPKTEAGYRIVPLTSKAIDALLKQRDYVEMIKSRGEEPLEGFENLVFVSMNCKPIVSSNLRVIMRKIGEKMSKELDKEELRKIHPHMLRHTFATRCIECGMNPKTLQVIMGHSSFRVTMDLYCHVTDDTLFSEMDKFEMASGV